MKVWRFRCHEDSADPSKDGSGERIIGSKLHTVCLLGVRIGSQRLLKAFGNQVLQPTWIFASSSLMDKGVQPSVVAS
jgi:anthranilate/para-aminobenzoate synthase component II